MKMTPLENLPHLQNLSIVELKPHGKTVRTSHPFHELILVTEGSLNCSFAGHFYEQHNGNVLVKESVAGPATWSTHADGCRAVFLHYVQDPMTPGVPPLCDDKSRRVRQLMDWIFEEAAAGLDDSLVGRTAGLIQAVLLQLVYHDHHQVPGVVAVVRDYILQRRAEPITLDDLAQVAGISKYYLTRIYKEATGTTPMAELRTDRLNATRHYLIHTDHTLRDIAKLVGHKDEFHLSRSFKKQFGISPREFRQQLRANSDSTDA